MTTAEIKGRERVHSLTTKEIIIQFEMTETINNEYIPTVRGWYMDELESRDAEAFDRWMDSEEDSPRKFYI